MAKKRSDADSFVHPALAYIRKKGMTRTEAAKILGLEDVRYLNLVLDRWRNTTDEWKTLFHSVFKIPYAKMISIPVRLPADKFKKNLQKQKRSTSHEQA